MSEQEERPLSKARERQRRRKERQLKNQGVKPISRRINQIRPMSDRQFGLSNVDLNKLRPIIMVVGAIIFMIALIYLVGLFKNEPKSSDPNAIWLGAEWTYSPQDEEAVKELVEHLHEYKIGVVYAHVSELNFDNTWTGIPERLNRFSEVEDNVRDFREQLKKLDKDLVVYGAVYVRSDIDSDGYRLDEGVLQVDVAEFSENVINNLGFDGVIIQVEPVLDGDQNYLDLLERVRSTIGETALLSISVPPDWTPEADIPMSSRIAAGWAWSEQYKQRIGLKQVNQIVIRAYDSGMTSTDDYTPDDYSAWVAYQIQAYVNAITSLELDTEIIVGVSTTDNIAFAHDTQIEDVSSAINGIQLALLNLGDQNNSLVGGIAIFNWESTGEVEWVQLKTDWIDR